MPECMQCHRALQSVEIALTKKLINRGATRFLCLNCLGKKFGVSEETLLQKAKEEYVKATGGKYICPVPADTKPMLDGVK